MTTTRNNKSRTVFEGHCCIEATGVLVMAQSTMRGLAQLLARLVKGR
jgi:hypothetical protein